MSQRKQLIVIKQPENAYLAPAKLNLMLKVIGRREDGFHLLETVFCLIDLYDTVYITPRNDGKIILHNTQKDIPPQQNLVLKAAKLLQQVSGCLNKGADIEIEKIIPVGGGLGGGSSDAATVLIVLNHLWQCNLSRQKLQEISVSLGADVPFFIFGKNAFAQGIGEKLSELSIPEQEYLIVKPPVFISTANIFQHPNLTRNDESVIINDFNDITLRNTLESVVVSEYPQVKTALNQLKKHGKAMLTGSGSCVFMPTDSRLTSQKIATEFDVSFKTFCVRSLNHHPLYHLL